MSHKIYAPNVHLFAFHFGNGSSNESSSRTDFDSELLWQKCSEIFAYFQIPQKLIIKPATEDYRVYLLAGESENKALLPLSGKILLAGQETRITGFACPLQIEKSYALALNIRIPQFDGTGEETEEIDISSFRNLNPANCFLPEQINSSLGQTLLITAWLSPQQQAEPSLWRVIADQCVQDFLGESKVNCPPLSQEDQLFGSPIFEYGTPYQNQTHGHLFVWFFFRPTVNTQSSSSSNSSDENFSFFYQKLIDLCYLRQKIFKVYQLSRSLYEDIFTGHQQIKVIINEVARKTPVQQPSKTQNKTGSLSDSDLNYFQEQLKTLPQLALQYSDWRSDLERYRLIVDMSRKTYGERIRQIDERLPNNDLGFLVFFQEKTALQLQKEIEACIDSCAYSSNLVDKALISIRGIVEIEQTQRERALEEAMRDSETASRTQDERLQSLIVLIIIGLCLVALFS
ncbi:MAG: hypothetical protein WA919_09705 [Coleofasciculaceae cyanobacterium]